jgi:hypothetical protein
MIYHAVSQPWPAIDATPSVTIIHQNHDYAHLPQGQMHYDLEETQRNVKMAGGKSKMYMLLDTEMELVDGNLRRPRPRLARLVRGIERRLMAKLENSRFGKFLRPIRRFRRRLTGTLKR